MHTVLVVLILLSLGVASLLTLRTVYMLVVGETINALMNQVAGLCCAVIGLLGTKFL